MTDFTLVCPLAEDLFPRLSGRRVVFVCEDPGAIPDVRGIADRHRIELACVYVTSPRPLCDIDCGGWGDTPVALQVPALGRFCRLVAMRPEVARANVRIYLPASSRRQCTDVRILASLGFHCCALLAEDGQEVDWQAVHDLAVYCLYCGQPHGDVDPFSYIASHYEPDRFVDFRSVYFDDPRTYLHVDAGGRLSLSRRERLAGNSIGLPLERCDEVRELELYRQALDGWKSFFVEPTPCARCEGWRVCRGAFAGRGTPAECGRVFAEVLEGAERHRNLLTRARPVWRP